METSELEEKIFSALKNDKKILELLPDGESSIFHLQAPSTDPALPILVYSPISDVPILHGDNCQLPANKFASLGSETPNCLDTAGLLKIVSNSE